MMSSIILKNIPEEISDEDNLRNFIGSCLDYQINYVTTYPSLPGMALVSFVKEIDFESVSHCLQEEEEVEIETPQTKEYTVVVRNRDSKENEDVLSKEFLEIYFCSCFGDGGDIVKSCDKYRQSEKAFVAFVTFQCRPEIMRNILQDFEQEPFPSENYFILVEPFCSNFHGHLLNNMRTGVSVAVHEEAVNVEHVTETEDKETRREKGAESKEESEESDYEMDTDEMDAESEEDTSKNVKSPIVSDIVEIPAFKANFLDHWKIVSGDCRVSFNQSHNQSLVEVNFEGPEDLVRDKVYEFLKESETIKEDSIPLTRAIRAMIQKPVTRCSLIQQIKTIGESIDCKIEVKDDSIHIWAKACKLAPAVERLREIINGSISVRGESTISRHRFKDMKLEIESEFFVILTVKDEKIILIEGMKDCCEKAENSISSRIHGDILIQGQFEVKGIIAKHVYQNLLVEIPSLLGKEVDIKDDVKSEEKVSFSVWGTKPEVDEVMKKLHSFKDDIETKQIKLDAKEDGWLLKSADDKVLSFEKRNKCAVCLDLPPIVQDKKGEKKPSVKGTRQKGARSSQKRHVNTDCNKTLTYKLNGSVSLEIKEVGKIEKDDSQVLVNLLMEEKKDLCGTNVGKAFNTACPSLRNTLKQAVEQSPNPSVVVTKGTFQGLPSTCQAIYHVVLPKYTGDPSKTILQNAVTTLVALATKAGLTSMAIPALGCGRAHKFPAHVVGDTVITALKASVPNSSLTKIVLISGDSRLHTGYQNACADLVPVLPVGGATNGAEEDQETSSGDSNGEESEEEQPLPGELGSITVCANKKQNAQKLCSELKQELSHYLQEEKSEFYSIGTWPRHSINKIISEAKLHTVWVKWAQSKDKGYQFTVKGEKNAVKMMINLIADQYKTLKISRKCIASNHAPKRGTKDFLKYAASIEEVFPSYWQKNKVSRDSPKKTKGQESDFLVDVGQTTFRAIKNMVSSTFDQHLATVGNDSRNLNFQNIQVDDVKRVENPGLFSDYSKQRQKLFEKTSRLGKVCTDIGKLQKSSGSLETTCNLPDSMKSELYWEINEHYLLHGMPADILNTVIKTGPDFRVGSEGGMLGKGFYMADKSTKANQYADHKDQRMPNGSRLNMVLFRALLGSPFVCTSQHPSIQNRAGPKLSRPPCIKCFQCVCKCDPQVLFDSVMLDDRTTVPGGKLFREFVVYDLNLCYPEYVIYYHRV